jgi:mycothiol system anti-sigma-R factor
VINCQDCVKALNPYLDRELSDDDIAQVRQHLEACGGCLHVYQFQESLRRLVRVKCREQVAPDSLRARISVSLAIERTRLENQRLKRRPAGPSFPAD